MVTTAARVVSTPTSATAAQNAGTISLDKVQRRAATMSSVSEGDVERIDENVNGLFQLVSALKDRIEELEDENSELRAQVEMLKMEVAENEC